MFGRTNSHYAYATTLAGIIQGVDKKQLDELASVVLGKIVQRRQILVIGNGGMASVSSHIAEDFTSQLVDAGRDSAGRFRPRVWDLTANAPWLLALGNDLGFEHVFSEQLRHGADKGDLLLALSCSGNSANIVKACTVARGMKMDVWAITDKTACGVDDFQTLKIPSTDTGMVQDAAMSLMHWMLGYLYEQLVTKEGRHVRSSDTDQSADCSTAANSREG